jgi:putative nucleotidyltransferase with HDIG domain
MPNQPARTEESLQILRDALRGTGYEHDVYLVGGAVRDELLGLPVKDLDFVVANHGVQGGVECATALAHALGNLNNHPVIYPTYGTAKLSLPNGDDVEFVAPRREKYEAESRKPVVEPGTLMDDAMRRDFTVNALFRRLSTGELLDLTGRGLQHLEQKRLETTSEAAVIFSEDPLRMIRAVRFGVKYGFAIPLSLLRAIKQNAHRLRIISEERIRDEFDKILVLNQPSRAMRLFKLTGLLAEFLPELQALVGVVQNRYHDRDAFRHTLDVLDATPKDRLTRLSAVFHDIGKAATRTQDEDGTVHFLGHQHVGADIARAALNRLRYSNEDVDHVVKLTLYHMDLKFGKDDLSGLKDKHVRKLLFKVGASLNESLLDLVHADNLSHAPGHAMPNQIPLIRERMAGWDQTPVAVSQTKSLLNGLEIMAMGVPPGKLVGIIKDRLVQEMLEFPELTKERATQIAQDIIEAHTCDATTTR